MELWEWVADHAPRKLVYWCSVRMMAYASTKKFRFFEMGAIKGMDAVVAWYKQDTMIENPPLDHTKYDDAIVVDIQVLDLIRGLKLESYLVDAKVAKDIRDQIATSGFMVGGFAPEHVEFITILGNMVLLRKASIVEAYFRNVKINHRKEVVGE